MKKSRKLLSAFIASLFVAAPLSTVSLADITINTGEVKNISEVSEAVTLNGGALKVNATSQSFGQNITVTAAGGGINTTAGQTLTLSSVVTGASGTFAITGPTSGSINGMVKIAGGTADIPSFQFKGELAIKDCYLDLTVSRPTTTKTDTGVQKMANITATGATIRMTAVNCFGTGKYFPDRVSLDKSTLTVVALGYANNVGSLTLSNGSKVVNEGTGSAATNFCGSISASGTGNVISLSSFEYRNDQHATTGNGTIDVAKDSQLLISSAAIKQAGLTMTKTGAGTLTVTGAMSGGSVNITGGTFQLGNGTTTGSMNPANIAIASGANLTINKSNDLTLTSVISNSGTITKSGAGKLVLSNATSVLTGALVYNAGTIEIQTAKGKITQLGAITGAADKTLFITGDGTLKLTTSETGYLGAYDVNGATLILSSLRPNATSSSKYKMGNISVTNGTLDLQAVNPMGTGDVYPNMLTLTNSVLNQSYVGWNNIGAVTLDNSTIESNGAGCNTHLCGEVLVLSDSTISLPYGFRIAPHGVTANGTLTSGLFTVAEDATLTLTNDLGSTIDAVTITKAGKGTLIANSANTNTQAGSLAGLVIKEGVFELGDSAANPTKSINPGTIQIAQDAQLVFNKDNNAAFTGSISGSGSITNIGRAALALSGDATGFGGSFRFEDGTIDLSAMTSFPTDASFIFDLNEIEINSPDTTAPLLKVAAGVDVNALVSAMTFEYDTSNLTRDTKIDVNLVGGVTLSDNDIQAILTNSSLEAFQFASLGGGVYELTADTARIPEPSSWILLILGATGLYFNRRRKVK